jgi:hypothetical protein
MTDGNGLSSTFLLIGLTIVAWTIHAFLARSYSKLFSSTKNPGFRTLHVTEISFMVFLAMLVYFELADERLSLVGALATVLGTLVLVDGLLVLVSKSLRSKFDIWHFAAAYIAISVVVVVFYLAKT